MDLFTDAPSVCVMSNVPGVAGQGGEHSAHYPATTALQLCSQHPERSPQLMDPALSVGAQSADVTKNIRRHRSKKHW